MSDNGPPPSNIILYKTEDGGTRIQCRFDNETIWLTQALIAELFQIGVNTVNHHLKEIYDKGEVERTATIRQYRIVRTEGSREVGRAIEHYSLPVIPAGALPRPVDADFEEVGKELQRLPRPKKGKPLEP